jgi:ribulose-5-phosphate 4-epimerase/fuculose-1-phosphate aldolase
MLQDKESEIRRIVVDLAQQFLEIGLVVRTWGNFSGRLDEDTFVVTPSGRA